MAKAKLNAARRQERLSTHKFDTANYIVLDTGTHRDPSTGQLVPRRRKQEHAKSVK
jgi:hypothetical protein